MKQILLAFDGSPKAWEALYIAAYLAGKWGLELDVITVLAPGVVKPTQAEARQYLEEHGVAADYFLAHGPVVKEIIITSEQQHSDLLLMGGYGRNPLVSAAIGDTVNQVLRESFKPVLICR